MISAEYTLSVAAGRLAAVLIPAFLSAALSAGCAQSPIAADTETDAKIVPLLVFAAAGTRAPSAEICRRFEQRTGRRIEVNFAASGTLARQIADGAPADIFVSADEKWIEFLGSRKMLKTNSIQKIAGNSLVLIALKDRVVPMPKFTGDDDLGSLVADKIAVGDPAYVPVGKYTQSAFEALGWQEQLRDKMILAKDVSSVLRYVALGECDLGVVYRSEAEQSAEVQIVADIPRRFHPPIAFFAAEVVGARSNAAALKEAFSSEEGRSTFLKFGFSTTGQDTE